MPGRLSTHVLDTAHGRPAGGISVSLYVYNDGVRTKLKSAKTDDDGRVILLNEGELNGAEYEIVFAVGAYFAGLEAELYHDLSPQDTVTFPHVGQRRFLELVPIRFGIPRPNENYHVPLLVSPWAYSTYRGS